VSFAASPREQLDQCPSDAAPAPASPRPRGRPPARAPNGVDQPVGEELRIVESGERLLRRAIPDPDQRVEVQVSADVAAEEPQHRGGVLEGGDRFSLRLRRSRLESVAAESGEADGHRDPEVEEGAGDGAR